MSDLTTTCMGLSLRNPVVVASSTLSSRVESIQQAEELGAGALVIRSLFEEQVNYESAKMEEALQAGAESFAEALSYLPMLQHAGAREHLMWVEKARAAVKMPLIGSLNATTGGKWVDFARQMAGTGVNAIELNVYAVETDAKQTAADVEQRLFATFEAVRAAVKLPVAVKLSPFYSSLPNVVAGLEKRGAAAVVLFNRFLQPDIDIKTESLQKQMGLSRSDEMRLPLRWVALLHGRTKLDLIASTGVEQPADVVKYLLAGATAVQTCSALYRHGLPHLKTLVDGVNAWMKEKGYARVADFRGKVSQGHVGGNLFDFERAQYVGFLLSQKG